MADRTTEVLADALNILANSTTTIKVGDAGKLNQLVTEFADIVRNLQNGHMVLVPAPSGHQVEKE